MSMLQVIQQMNDDAANDKARVLRLSKELKMLKAAQPNLSGTAAWLNKGRIAKIEDQLHTLTYLLALYQQEDAAECEIKAALESVVGLHGLPAKEAIEQQGALGKSSTVAQAE